MIKQIYLNNYRRFINSTINFENNTTLIAGKNGTGKTALAELIYSLSIFISGATHISSIACETDIPRWERKDFGRFYADIELLIDDSGDSFSYTLKIEHNMKTSDCRIFKESLSLNQETVYEFLLGDEPQVSMITDDKRNFQYPADWNISGLPLASRRNSKIKKFYDYCNSKIYAVSLNPEIEKHNGEIFQKDCSKLDFQGKYFEKWYGKLLPKNIEQVSQTNKEYKYFIQDLLDVGLNDIDQMYFTEKSNNGTYKIYFSELSLGQKKLCIYYFLLNIAERGSTIIIDELECHLSPAELQPLYNKLQDISDEKDIQFIVISHNPKTLNWYHKDAIVLRTSGSPLINRVEVFEHEKIQKSLFEYIEEQSNEF